MEELLSSWCCSFTPNANPNEDSKLPKHSKPPEPRKSRRQERSVKFAQHGHGGCCIDGSRFWLNSNPLAAQSSEFEGQTDSISLLQDDKLAGAVPWSVLEANAKPPSDGMVHLSLAKPSIAEHYSQQEEKRRAFPDQTLRANIVSSRISAPDDPMWSKLQEPVRLRKQASIASRVSCAFESRELHSSRSQQLHAQQVDALQYLYDQPGRCRPGPPRRRRAPAAAASDPPAEAAFAPLLYLQRERASSAASSSAASSAAGTRRALQ